MTNAPPRRSRPSYPFTAMPLSPHRSRWLVAGFVLVMLALAALATAVITRGWKNDALQERIRQLEAEGVD